VATLLIATPAAATIAEVVHVTDPVAYAASLLFIGGACLVAASIPARRAARLDPTQTLPSGITAARMLRSGLSGSLFFSTLEAPTMALRRVWVDGPSNRRLSDAGLQRMCPWNVHEREALPCAVD
jgi:hypothetical protein